MFEDIFNAVGEAVEGLVDLLSSFLEKVTQSFLDFMVGYMEIYMNFTTDALINYGFPRDERIKLSCGGHVEIDYYVRYPG